MEIDDLMQQMPTNWWYRWCESKMCACLGCANVSGKLVQHGFTKNDWIKWIQNNPQPEAKEELV